MSRFPWFAPSLVVVALALSACHHGGDDDDDSPAPSQATTFTVGGTVTGLNGTTVLRLNGGNDLNVSASGAFTFSGVALASGASYAVIVATNPAGQSCAVTNAAGTIASANVTNVTVTCFGFSLGGTVTGLTKSGLVLEVNGINDLPVAPNASSFTFSASTQLGPSFGIYFAGIKTQPTGQTCTIVQAMGVVTAAAPNVSGASGPAVDCVDNVTDSFTGTYSVNDDDHTGTRAYITFFADGTYLLGVRGDDAGCPSNGNGIQYGVYNWNQATQVLEIVKHAAVGLGDECGFDVGTRVTLSPDSEDGTIALIETGGGAPQFVGALAPVPSTTGALIGSWGTRQSFVVFSSDNTFFLATARSVVQSAGPSPGIEEGCYSSTGASSGNLTFNLGTSCTVGGKPALDTTGPSAFSSVAGAVPFSVNGDTIQSTAGLPASPFVGPTPRMQPTALPSSYQISATIGGLTGAGLVLQTNGKSAAAIATNATSAVVATDMTSGTSYFVNVRTQPAGQYCTVANGTGVVFAAVTNVAVTCTAIPATTYFVSGTLSNVAGTGLALQLNGHQGDPNFNVSPGPGATSYNFAAPLQMGTPFAVVAVGHPSAPLQFCFPTVLPTGTIVSSNVTVPFNCIASNPYTVGGVLGGLAPSTSVTLRVNSFDAAGVPGAPSDHVLASNSPFTLPGTIAARGLVDVGIGAQPAGQTCTIVRGRAIGGLAAATAYTGLGIACVANSTDPLSGTYSVLDDRGRQYINFNADGTYTTAMIHNQWDCQTIASPQNVGNGVEYGIFTWNQATGAIQLPAKAVIDTNGGCGFSDPGGENFGGSVTRVGNTIELRESAGGSLIATAPAVESVPDTLVGGWVREAGNGTLLVFHADGTFLYVDPQSANLDPNNLYGQERGCYSTSGGSVTFTIDAACEPDGLASYDLNSAGGFLSVPAVTSLTVPYTVTGDTLAFNGSTITFKRTHPN